MKFANDKHYVLTSHKDTFHKEYRTMINIPWHNIFYFGPQREMNSLFLSASFTPTSLPIVMKESEHNRQTAIVDCTLEKSAQVGPGAFSAAGLRETANTPMQQLYRARTKERKKECKGA